MFPPDRRGKPEEDPIEHLRALLSGLQREAKIDCDTQPAWRDREDVLKRINRAVELFEIVAVRFKRTTDALHAKGDTVVDGIDWEGLPERFGKVVVDHMEQAKFEYEKRSEEWRKNRKEGE